MSRVRFVAFVLFVSFVMLVSYGCTAAEPPATADPPASAETAAPATTRWHLLGTWSGRGDIQTESFDVTTGALRLAWAARNEDTPGTGTLRVSLHSAISGRPLQTIVDRKGTGAETAYLEDEPRVSYLVIESAQVDWTVTLEEAVPGSPTREPSR